jgi:hypothetical protein
MSTQFFGCRFGVAVLTVSTSNEGLRILPGSLVTRFSQNSNYAMRAHKLRRAALARFVRVILMTQYARAFYS